jgi:hypothetical protein
MRLQTTAFLWRLRQDHAGLWQQRPETKRAANAARVPILIVLL